MDRKGLRQAVIDDLLNQTNAGDKVFRSKPTPVDGDKTPAITVYLNRSSGQIPGSQLVQFNVDHEIKVECYVAASADWDDELDTLIDQVEARLFASQDSRLIKLATITAYSIDLTFNDGGEVPIACGILTINAKVIECFDPGDDPALPNFLRAHIDIDQAPADGQIEVSGDIELEPAA